MKRTRLAIVAWSCVGLILGWLLSSFVLQLQSHVTWKNAALRWQAPHYLWLLLGVFLAVLIHLLWNITRRPHLRFSRVHTLARAPKSWRSWFAEAPTGLLFASFVLVTVALAGPQSTYAIEKREQSGIEIMLTLDMSGSMQAEDVHPNRFLATQAVVDDFIQRRPNDRIGAVVFAVDAYTLLPLTTDQGALRNAIASLQLEEIDPQGTAIGNAIGNSLNRLRHTDAKSKVIILLTDGESNAGNLTPDEAADIAATMGVKIYPVLMGAQESSSRPTLDIFGSPIAQLGQFPINPDLLRNIARKTQGEFFAVSDRRSLEQSFHQILDRLQKTELQDAGKVYSDLYSALVWPALGLLILSITANAFVLRRWP